MSLKLMDLPPEIIDSIVSFVDDPSKLVLRGVGDFGENTHLELRLYVQCPIFLIPIMTQFKNYCNSNKLKARCAELPKQQLLKLVEPLTELTRGCAIGWFAVTYEGQQEDCLQLAEAFYRRLPANTPLIIDSGSSVNPTNWDLLTEFVTKFKPSKVILCIFEKTYPKDHLLRIAECNTEMRLENISLDKNTMASNAIELLKRQCSNLHIDQLLNTEQAEILIEELPEFEKRIRFRMQVDGMEEMSEKIGRFDVEIVYERETAELTIKHEEFEK